MTIKIAEEDELPTGPHRDMVVALYGLYVKAGRPPLRLLAHKPGPGESRTAALSERIVSRILKGQGPLPPWEHVKMLLRPLVERATADWDVNELVYTVRVAWSMAADAVEQHTRPKPKAGAYTDFQSIRRQIGVNAPQLISKSIEQHNKLRHPEVPLLTKEGWIPTQPLNLKSIHLELDTELRCDFTEAHRQTFHYWPEVPGNPHPSYAQAVSAHDQPGRWYNGRSFRLTDVVLEPSEGREVTEVKLCFGLGTYFEAFDTCEPLGYEAALRCVETKGATINGPYREWLKNPFELHNRCAIPGVNTLTIRRSRNDTTFYLHERTGVATAMGTTHVIPAGEFQPSGQVSEASEAELDLRSTIVREYAEEFLNAVDVISQQQHETQVDLDRQYPLLNRAVIEGAAKIHYLGLGIYPLTWKPEILVVCVFDGPLFDRVFKDMVKEVYEGKLVGEYGVDLVRRKGFRYMLPGRKGPFQGLRFDEETVLSRAHDPTTLPAARACLILAWKHREYLGLVS